MVTSAAPIVDTRTTTQTSILTDEAIQAIPTGRTTTGFAQLIPGISIEEGGQKFQDVGGLAGEGNSFVIHGSRDNEGGWFVNGMPHTDGNRANAWIIRLDVGQVEEFTLETSAISAEYREGGVTLNLMGKEGANQFFGTMFVSYANGGMQGNNFDDELRTRGVRRSQQARQELRLQSVGRRAHHPRSALVLRDLPIMGNRQQARRHLLGQGPHRFPLYARLEPAACLGRAQQEFRRAHDVAGHDEAQVPVVLPAAAPGRVCEQGAQPDAGGPDPSATSLGNGNIYSQVLYSAPITSRVLIEGGYWYLLERSFQVHARARISPGPAPCGASRRRARGTFTTTRSMAHGTRRSQFNGLRLSMLYVTGSHALKVGVTDERE